MSFSVAVAGASGYAGGELLRILAQHPEFDVRTVTAHSSAGQPLARHQPHLRSLAGLTILETSRESLSGHDIVFLALPHGMSGAITDAIESQPEDADTLIVDCGADHRLTNAADWATFYSGDYHGAWTYGVPELPTATGKLRDTLIGAKRIAAPGCNASAVSLAIAPGIASGLIEERDIVAVLAVGPSGAGKKLETRYLAGEILGSASPYAVGGTHRHIPEIQQNLRLAGAHDPTVSFTPVLVPMARGILATVSARIAPGTTAAQLRQAWEAAYDGEPFVHVLPAGQMPRTADTLGANTALIGLAVDEAVGRVIAVLAMDNLAKGTAGAAIQSANIALGLPEQTGLTVDGVAP
jgi:N-acetyl-gamma-glutamyl-phosphate reductase